MRPRVRREDMGGLRALAAKLKVKLAFSGEPPGPRTIGGPPEQLWSIRYLADGACPFLDRDTNLCRIYDDRPEACRKFPHRPFVGCLLRPGREGADPPVSPLGSSS
jgi:hypothetical protein